MTRYNDHNLDYDLELSRAKLTFNKVQWMSKKANERRMTAKLQSLIKHAFLNVPIYKKIMHRTGLRPEDFQCLADLRKLPIVNKSVLSKGFPRNTTSHKLSYRCILNNTSGSTGEPFKFYIDSASLPLKEASELFFREWTGIDFMRMSEVFLAAGYNLTAPSYRELFSRIYYKQNNPVSILKRKYSMVKVWINKRSLVDGFRTSLLMRLFGKPPRGFIIAENVSSSSIKMIYRYMESLAPYWIQGYTSIISFIAKEIKHQEIEITDQPKAVICTSENLNEKTAQTIKSSFNSTVFNKYGTMEFGPSIAFTCPEKNSLHFNSDLVILEVVDSNGEWTSPGEVGKILITDLTNYVMPFIRYEVGDMGIRGDCGCLRGFPSLKSIEGRTNEQIHSSEGKVFSSATLSLPWISMKREYTDKILEFQFIQEKFDEVDLLIVPAGALTSFIKNQIISDLATIMDGIKVKIKVVDKIPRPQSGKRPLIISKVSQRYWSS